MSRAGLADRQILIIDSEDKVANDRTWCFWSKATPPFEDIIHHSWPQLIFADDDGVVRSAMGGYQYHLIRGIDFYHKVIAELRKDPNVHFLTDRVDNIVEGPAMTTVWTSGARFTADWVLSSIVQRPSPGTLPQDAPLWQHFAGWWIETKSDRFDPTEGRLMDFSVQQEQECRFMYVLPVTRRKALVEFTVFSQNLLTPASYDEALRKYIGQQLQIAEFTIDERESGCIPMTHLPLSRYQGARILPIGTAGGWVKPSTGYAFVRIQQKASLLAADLLANRPVTLSDSVGRFAFYDKLLLHILTRQGTLGKRIFTALFRNNPMFRILNFLHERSSLYEEILIFGSLPAWPFLRACWERFLSKMNKTEKPIFSISGETAERLHIEGNSEEIF